jgi:DNA-binding transcriptional MocR family regulator
MPQSSTLYQSLAGEIAGLITAGTLRPGDRIPSVRELSRSKSASVSSVLSAYRVLEDRGLVESRPQSGYYVRTARVGPAEPARTAPPEAASSVEIGELTLRYTRDTHDPKLIQLGAALPHPDLLPTAKLARSIARMGRLRRAQSNSYDLPTGCLSLREQVAKRMFKAGVSVGPEAVITTAGAQEALNLALHAVCSPGDIVAVESPAFFGTLQAVEMHGLKAVEIATEARDGMCLDALKRALSRHKIRAVISTPTFSNPLGALMPEARKKALVELLAARKIPLIEDDVYGDLPHDGLDRPKAAKAFDRDGGVIYCSSVSKTMAPGYRVGWIIPGRWRSQVERFKMVSNVSSACLPQLAVADILANGGYDRHLRRIRAAYARTTAQMRQAVAAGFPEGTRLSNPRGGFVLWAELPGKADALALYDRARRSGVVVAPGPLFSATGRFRGAMRLNCSHWNPQIERAVGLLGRLAAEAAR